VLAKSLGTTNPINMAKATVVALRELRRPEDVARIRGKQISEVLPLPQIKKGSPEEAAARAARIEAEATPKPKKRAPAKPKTEAKPKAEVGEAVAEVNGGDQVAESDQVAVSEPPAPAAEEEKKPKRRVGLRKKKDD
jgi:hypothetical protein